MSDFLDGWRAFWMLLLAHTRWWFGVGVLAGAIVFGLLSDALGAAVKALIRLL